MDPMQFVELLELDEHHASDESFLVVPSGKPSAVVNKGSLVSFAANLNSQQKDDILDGTLLAQLAASKKYDSSKYTEEWYKVYIDVLQHIGWVVQEFKFDEYESDQENFKISDVVLELLKDVVGGNADVMEVVKQTLDSLKKSPDAVSLFGSHSYSHGHGKFQIVPCNVDHSNQINIALAAFHFQASKGSDNYLFYTWKKESIHLFKGIEICTLDQAQYGRVRQAIKDKLGNSSNIYVKIIDI